MLMRPCGWVLVLAAATAFADGRTDVAPGVTPDGSRIVVWYVAEDGARGAANLTVLVADRTGKIIRSIPVSDADRGDVPGGSAAADKLVADLKPVAMTQLEPKPHDDDTHLAFDGLDVSLSPTGALRVTPKGHRAIVRSNPEWRTKPSPDQAARMQRAIDDGKIECFNPGGIGAVYLDAARRAAVVYIRFHGNDTCWEPSSDVEVFAW
jgi:hypothetical protein